MLALMVKLNRVSFASTLSLIDWDYILLLKFVCFANNLASKHDTNRTMETMETMAGSITPLSVGQRYSAWHETVLMRLLQIRGPSGAIVTITFQPMQFARLLVGSKVCREGDDIIAMQPCIVPVGTRITLERIHPTPLALWQREMPFRIGLAGWNHPRIFPLWLRRRALMRHKH